jgi:hypothetical protein
MFHDLAHLLARSLPELEDEPSATGRHHEQPVEIEVRAPLGAVDDMVDLEGAPPRPARTPLPLPLPLPYSLTKMVMWTGSGRGKRAASSRQEPMRARPSANSL